ncbi:hypothetical protein BDP81DRAFT_33395 [Colletotrichum phormii]|uniref:Uncharacterized protein n=1 Tax=Colletotrichum phormii TaxID=359342 RepID=A0AAI9ZQP5_9PEZI|nr:uncharacterized protein BDP81DRAFT_33395 [Colletotrichum phormii]KAK1636090.1 hypothetical protein BDP81DRAFT_33395 [Colletotrichum phormii]
MGRTGRPAVVRFLHHGFSPRVALDLDNLSSAMQALVRLILLDAASPNVIATGQYSKRTHATFYIPYDQHAQVADPLRYRQVHWVSNLPIISQPTMACPLRSFGEAGAAVRLAPCSNTVGVPFSGCTGWPIGDAVGSDTPSAPRRVSFNCHGTSACRFPGQVQRRPVCPSSLDSLTTRRRLPICRETLSSAHGQPCVG